MQEPVNFLELLEEWVRLKNGRDLSECGRDLSEWLEHLTAIVNVASPGFDPSIVRHSGI